MDGFLDINNFETTDFDVFLSQPDYFTYAFCESDRRCNQDQVFSYTHDLFAAFCSVLIRMNLNIAMKIFSALIFNISLADKKNLLQRF